MSDTRRTNEAVGFCSSLIRIDTTNTGDEPTTVGEAEAAQFVVRVLEDVGLEPETITPRPGRSSVVVRLPGTDPNLGALLVHGHLDVVPADPAGWSRPPFSGAIDEGCVWGRGAVDMKGFVAMTLAVIRRWRRDGTAPRRDLVFAWLADEENGGEWGAQWLCTERPDLLAGCTEAIGEIGGFQVPITPDCSLYPIMTGEKGFSWAKVTTSGVGGHGSLLTGRNAAEVLADIIGRVAAYEFPLRTSDITETFLSIASERLGLPSVEGPLPDRIGRIGRLAALVEPGARSNIATTVVRAGTKINAAPRSASAWFDCRTLPGDVGEVERCLEALVGDDGEVEWIQRGEPVVAPFECELVSTMTDVLRQHDPAAVPVPYMVSAGTDAKSFAATGIRCYGFSPMTLPSGGNFGEMFHGVDERIPIRGLGFGAAVLDDFLLRA